MFLCFKRNAKGTHLYSRWAYKRGRGGGGGAGLYPGGAYIRNNIFVGKWNGLISGGCLKTGGGGALKWDFTVFELDMSIVSEK